MTFLRLESMFWHFTGDYQLPTYQPYPGPSPAAHLPHSFRGLATFSDNRCDESGGGVYNGADSKMT